MKHSLNPDIHLPWYFYCTNIVMITSFQSIKHPPLAGGVLVSDIWGRVQICSLGLLNSIYSPPWYETQDTLALTSQVLDLQVCTTSPEIWLLFLAISIIMFPLDPILTKKLCNLKISIMMFIWFSLWIVCMN